MMYETNMGVSSVMADRKGILLLGYHSLFDLVDRSFSGSLSFRAEDSVGFRNVIDRFEGNARETFLRHWEEYDPDKHVLIVVSVCVLQDQHREHHIFHSFLEPKPEVVCRPDDDDDDDDDRFNCKFNCKDKSSKDSMNFGSRSMCLGCGKESKNECTICKAPYCSKECIRGDWSEHKTVCRRVRSLLPPRLMMNE